MFDIGWQELFILAVLAIIVIGPKDLPKAIGTITKWIRKARTMARDLQDGLDEVAREAELDELKKELERPGGLDLAKRIEKAVDPTGEITANMDLDKDVYDEMSDAVEELKKATQPDDGKAQDKTDVSDTADDASKAPDTAKKASKAQDKTDVSDTAPVSPSDSPGPSKAAQKANG